MLLITDIIYVALQHNIWINWAIVKVKREEQEIDKPEHGYGSTKHRNSAPPLFSNDRKSVEITCISKNQIYSYLLIYLLMVKINANI